MYLMVNFSSFLCLSRLFLNLGDLITFADEASGYFLTFLQAIIHVSVNAFQTAI